MINNVRRTVLAILNKNNYGYISPDDFNNYARVAQLEVFENYVHQFNKENNKINSRMAGSGHADNRARINGEIDKFIVQTTMDMPTPGSNVLTLPNAADADGNDIFKIVSVSTRTETIQAGVYNFTAEAQKVSNIEMGRMTSSNFLSPGPWLPIYTIDGGNLIISGDSYTEDEIVIEYIRYPRIPNWTYINVAGGEPIFDSMANDFQDFEVGIAEETELINKILQMAGMSIREIQAVQAAGQEELERKTEQQ